MPLPIMSCPCPIFTDAKQKQETESITVPAILATIVALCIGVVLTVVVYIIVKKTRNRKSITVASGEMTLRSPNIYSSGSSNDASTINRERKVKFSSIH